MTKFGLIGSQNSMLCHPKAITQNCKHLERMRTHKTHKKGTCGHAGEISATIFHYENFCSDVAKASTSQARAVSNQVKCIATLNNCVRSAEPVQHAQQRMFILHFVIYRLTYIQRITIHRLDCSDCALRVFWCHPICFLFEDKKLGLGVCKFFRRSRSLMRQKLHKIFLCCSLGLGSRT